MRQRDRFRFLIAGVEDSSTLAALERRLSSRACRHKRVKIPRSKPPQVRLMVCGRDFDIAFRVLLEFTASSPQILHVVKTSGGTSL